MYPSFSHLSSSFSIVSPSIHRSPWKEGYISFLGTINPPYGSYWASQKDCWCEEKQQCTTIQQCPWGCANLQDSGKVCPSNSSSILSFPGVT